MTGQDEVLGWLRANPGPHTVIEVAEGLGVQDMDVRKALSKLHRYDLVGKSTAEVAPNRFGDPICRVCFEHKEEGA